MEMTGEHRIAAPRAQVWAALNDPEVLKSAIPGCEELIKSSDTEMSAKVRAKVGPVSARFAGKVTLSEIDPPNSYRISGEGSGGVAGFAKGGAKVSLSDDNGGTLMRYEVSAQVGGKLAQIGSRLIDGTAKQMAGEFFTKFGKAAESYQGGAAPAAATPAPEQAELPDSTPVAAPTSAPHPAAAPRPAATPSAIPDAEPTAAPDQAEQPDTTPVAAPAPHAAAAAASGAAAPAAVEELAPRSPAAEVAEPPSRSVADSTAGAGTAATPPKPSGTSPLIWVVGVIVVVGIILYFATR